MPDAPLHVFENITRVLPSLEPNERRSECGRLILAPDALHYVQGWETHEQRSGSTGILGAVLDLAARSPDVVDTRREGQRLLAEVAGLPPAEQVRSIAGSVTVPVADIDTARLGFFLSDLKLVTESRGDTFHFLTAFAHRRQIRAWLATLPRR